MNRRRKVLDRVWIALAGVAVVLAIAPLASILYYVLVRGIGAINVTFLTTLQNPINYADGGIGNALQGTFILVLLASAIGIPIGILSGVFVAEQGAPRYANSVHFIADVLVGIPSIVTGVLVYLLVTVPTHHFSALSGGVALGTIMIPIVSNTTSEALKLVPNTIREGSAALGIMKWRTTLTVISNARSGIVTGVFLAIARTTGETAPLLLTTLGSTLWYSGVNNPTASVTLEIYQYAISGDKVLEMQAWGASLILVMAVLGIDILIRTLTRSRIRFVQ